MKEYEKTIDIAAEALFLADTLKEVISAVAAQNLLAGAQARTGRYELAISNFESARSSARYLSLPSYEFGSVLGIAEVYERMGDIPTAIENMRKHSPNSKNPEAIW